MARNPNQGVEEYAALADALTDTIPPCADDWRYLADRHEIDDADLITMRATCRTCPLNALCATYANAARPTAGMWAGRYHGKPRKDTP